MQQYLEITILMAELYHIKYILGQKKLIISFSGQFFQKLMRQ